MKYCLSLILMFFNDDITYTIHYSYNPIICRVKTFRNNRDFLEKLEKLVTVNKALLQWPN